MKYLSYWEGIEFFRQIYLKGRAAKSRDLRLKSENLRDLHKNIVN